MFLASALISVGALALPDGPPPAHTGAHDQPDCSSCHFAGPDRSEASGLTMPGLPERITGGKRYEFTLVLRDPKSRVGGFQLMVDADNDRRGELIPVDGQQVEEHQGIQYLGHSEPRAMATDEASGERVTRWQIIWRAPADPGMIRVFATSVAGDDDMSPLGDNVYRLQATLTDKSN